MTEDDFPKESLNESEGFLLRLEREFPGPGPDGGWCVDYVFNALTAFIRARHLLSIRPVQACLSLGGQSVFVRIEINEPEENDPAWYLFLEVCGQRTLLDRRDDDGFAFRLVSENLHPRSACWQWPSTDPEINHQLINHELY